MLLLGGTIGIVLATGAASASVRSPLKTDGMPFASGSTTNVIVLLRNQAAGLTIRSAARSRLVRDEVAPLARTLVSHGANNVVSGKAVPFLLASVTSAQEAALKQNPAVRAVFPDAVIPAPTSELPADARAIAPVKTSSSTTTPTLGPGVCPSSPSSPERDPEALSVINAPSPTSPINGAGVKVAYIAGSIDTSIADFQRNSQYASTGSATGSPVVTNVNFSGDTLPTGGEVATESFGDASSIAAQGNTVYDLSDFVNTSHPLPTGCNITITGDAPGASVIGLDVFSNQHDTTEASFLQAIDYAVSHGVKVLNESFGANNYPDSARDATRIADDDAVAAGVTVVASTGDAGVTSTVGSPATDPKVISAGASTTFRGYAQDTEGGINATSPHAGNGTWIDNNISGLSSAGFSQAGGNTVEIVAPGDLNWAECSTNTSVYDCFDENNNPTGIQLFGGTSEASPLTAGAAADVIQAYQTTHGGASPAPALVKQILLSTATDIHAPAEQQGAGLLDIGAAIKEAESVNGASGTHEGGLLIRPNQINITQAPSHSTKEPVSITNTGSHSVTVSLSTRELASRVSHHASSFCLNPSASAISCGAPTAHTFQIWSGVTEVYQEETFTVPTTTGVSRLNFTADYPDTGQTSLLHVALYDPSGAYAGYSIPQGLANYANIQVADPKHGTWTAVFFTEQDGATAGALGTSGTIQWQADTWSFGHGGTISPSSLTIAPGASKTATFTAKSPTTPGDTAQSIVITSSGVTNTIPVTVRTLIAPNGAFAGVLTGGNGRGNPSQMNTYAFTVPHGEKDLDASLSLGNDREDAVVAYLVDPEGNAVASSSNVTLNSAASCCVITGRVNLYKDTPQPGRWLIVLDWLQPVSGTALSRPFTGLIQFNRVSATSNLPSGSTVLAKGHSYTFHVRVKNTAQSPESYFLDPRLNSAAAMQLPDLNGSDQNMTLPLPGGLSFPLYLVPTDSTAVGARITGTAPVSFDIEPWTGDPDIGAITNGDNASRILASGDELQAGAWLLNPSEVGPYPDAGAPPVTASATFDVVTKVFDSTVNPSTGDLWTFANGLTSNFKPVYLKPGQSATILLTITPKASSGTHVSGSIKLDDAFQADVESPLFEFAGGDELTSLPFSYKVK